MIPYQMSNLCQGFNENCLLGYLQRIQPRSVDCSLHLSKETKHKVGDSLLQTFAYS